MHAHTPAGRSPKGRSTSELRIVPAEPTNYRIGRGILVSRGTHRGHSVGRKVEVRTPLGKFSTSQLANAWSACMHPTPQPAWNFELGNQSTTLQCAGNQLYKVLKNAQNFGSGGSHSSLCQVVTAATLSVDVLITLYIPSSRLDVPPYEKTFPCDESDGMRLSETCRHEHITCRNVQSSHGCFVGSRLHLASSRLGGVRNFAASDHTASQTIEQ
jgi:hypothetical protein